MKKIKKFFSDHSNTEAIVYTGGFIAVYAGVFVAGLVVTTTFQYVITKSMFNQFAIDSLVFYEKEGEIHVNYKNGQFDSWVMPTKN